MKQQHGFVLVNALIIVAALAAAAVVLLARAETGRAKLEASQTSAQLGYYLDGFEALAINVLTQDSAFGAVDHLGEDWAKTDFSVTVDRGRVAGKITELQGLYNLNWLANDNRETAPATLRALLTRKGISPQITDIIAAYLRPGGPENRATFQALEPPIDPVGGALLLFEQLRDVPGLDVEKRDQLHIISTVLPGNTPVNVNTASPDLLIGMLPFINAGGLIQLIAKRDTEPFSSIEAFTREIELLAGGELPDHVDAAQFSVGSDWFRLDISAELNGLTATRTVVLHRLGLSQGIETHWRVTQFP